MLLAPFDSVEVVRDNIVAVANENNLSAFMGIDRMADIQAFRGIRYDLGHVGSLSEVIAPPYDVIDSDLQTKLYERHPANVVRLILNRDEPGDEPDAKYQRAARYLRNWQREGVLATENQPCIYVYHQSFEFGGQTYYRRGFMARLKLERFGEGSVFPHEETHSAAKADRLKLINACRANLSQIFGIYPDETNEAQEYLETAVSNVLPLEATDHLGVKHQIWPVSDQDVISKVTAAMGPKPIYIADGHHRYETACNYRDQLADGGSLPDNHPANYVLMMFVSMHDPGMIVLPTHRLFRGVPTMDSKTLSEKLQSCFDIETFGNGIASTNDLWEEIETEDEQTTLGLYATADQTWLRVRLNDSGQKRMAEICDDHGEAWQGLGVSILHRLIMEDCLGLKDLPSPKYVHAVDEVVEGLEKGDAVGRDATGQLGQGEAFQLACLVMPARLEDVQVISEDAERMPAKSTYFYPKLLSGLVINPLEV